MKHSGASLVRVTIRIDRNPPLIRVSAEDNGRGLPGAGTRPSGRNGLLNMRRRMAGVGGSCTVEPASPTGVRVTLVIPLDSDAARSAVDNPPL